MRNKQTKKFSNTRFSVAYRTKWLFLFDMVDKKNVTPGDLESMRTSGSGIVPPVHKKTRQEMYMTATTHCEKLFEERFGFIASLVQKF